MPLKKLTHPERIVYPKSHLTKQDIADYYLKIKDWILPYIIDRPLSLFRCPEGVENECFFQKHLEYSKGEIYSHKEYVYIKDVQGLLDLVQMNVLEIHAWGCQIKNIELPDMLIFDLDPGPKVAWKKVVSAAFLIKSELEKIKLKSFVKSTGGKGLHVVIPIRPEFDWKKIKNFSHTLVDYLVMQNPKDYIGKMTKSERTGKIFIDYLRNQRGATAIAPYSTRAREDATVAVPLSWGELTDHIDDAIFTVETLPERLEKLKKDPWEDFFKVKQTLSSV